MANVANTINTGPTSKNVHSGGKKFDGMRVRESGMKKLTNTMNAEKSLIMGMRVGEKLNLNSNVEGVIKSFKGGVKKAK